jgi:hypothetical protein
MLVSALYILVMIGGVGAGIFASIKLYQWIIKK